VRKVASLIRDSKPEPRLPATTVRIKSLNLKPKQKLLYLFDYGDEWRFEVEFLKEGLSSGNLPTLNRSRGEAPQQY
jgi:hypothetical protein